MVFENPSMVIVSPFKVQSKLVCESYELAKFRDS
jgi:hypothetical protein